jgi:hypothetical protein
MDWNAQIGRELRGLDGIIVILLGMAGLAERAAGAPYPIQCVVLWFLRQADAVATEFVASSSCATARASWLAARMTVRHGSHPDGEMDLALSLKRLARSVAALVTQLGRLAFLHRRRRSGRKDLDHGSRHGVPAAFGLTDPRLGCPDTS